MAPAVILESIWEKLDHLSLSRLGDGTPHSFSDLPYFTFLLPFYLDKSFQVQHHFSLFLLGQQFSKSNSSSLFSSDKNILSPTSIPQKFFKTIPNSVFSSKSVQFSKKILSPIFFLTSLCCLQFSHSCRWSLNSVH